MKNVTLMSGTQNHLAIKNSKHHVELHDAGMTAIKVGWSKFPTQTAWTKAGGTEEEYASILSACNALYKSLKNSDRASERLSSVWSCVDAEIINNEDPQILQAIQNLGKIFGHRVDHHHRVKVNVVETNSKTIRCWYKLLAGRKGICAPETFAPKAVVYIFQLMQGHETPDEAIASEKANSNSKNGNKPTQTQKLEQAENELKTERERTEITIRRAENAEQECKLLRASAKADAAYIQYLQGLLDNAGIKYDAKR